MASSAPITFTNAFGRWEFPHGGLKEHGSAATRESDALDLKRGVFKPTNPKKIAASLRRSAERSSLRKASAYRTALSMLIFCINRAGKALPKAPRDRLQRAKTKLEHQLGRE